MEMEQRQETCQEMTGETCTRLAVLEERVSGMERAHDGRLKVLEEGLGKLSTKLDGVVSAGWRQFWALAALIIVAAIGYAIWTNQMLLQHVAGR